MKEQIGGPATPPPGMEILLETTLDSKPPCYGRPTETLHRENGTATVRCRLCGNVWDEVT